jgi:putative transposase
MKRSRFTEEQTITGLREQEPRVSTAEVGSATFYVWKAKSSGMNVSDAVLLKQPEDENAKLEKLLAEAMLDTVALNDQPGKSSDAVGRAARSRLTARRSVVAAADRRTRPWGRLRELARERRRFGLPETAFSASHRRAALNREKTQRLYRDGGCRSANSGAASGRLDRERPILAEARPQRAIVDRLRPAFARSALPHFQRDRRRCRGMPGGGRGRRFQVGESPTNSTP